MANRKAKINKHGLQSAARKIVGRGNLKDLIIRAARKLNRPVPSGKEGGYALLAELVGTPGITTEPRKPRLKYKPPVSDVTCDEFLSSYEWRRLRMVVLTKRGARCECCGASPKDGIQIHVDHIKPRRKYPELALSEDNLQILCEVCNHGKGNWDETDWRDRLETQFAPVWSRRVN